MRTPALRLRPMRLTDEAVALAAHEVMQHDGFEFLLRYHGQPFADLVRFHARAARGLDLPDGLVPATFLLAEVDGEVVGRTSIRHQLNDFLRRQGGHIGYGILPPHRRRGYATEVLRQSLVVARSLGVDRVLVTCDDDNAGSATAIERNGGVLEDEVTIDGDVVRRYWID